MLGIGIIVFFMAIDTVYTPNSFWLEVLTGSPKWIAILSFMEFKKWTYN